jgi:hypothetical protein
VSEPGVSSSIVAKRQSSFWIWFSLLTTFSVCGPDGSALAAQITAVQVAPDEVRVSVIGQLNSGDGAEFDKIVAIYGRGSVVFDSDGGNLLAGLHIGTAIRLRNWSTEVLDGTRCASACALAWLGGTHRWMARTAQIGFHAAYIVGPGAPSETGAGNALVGAYLNRLGLSDRAIVYATSASPTEMRWLTRDDAKTLGVDVSDTRAPSSPTTVNPVSHMDAEPTVLGRDGAVAISMQDIARSFVTEYFAQWSQSNAVALSYASSAYSESVVYYGKIVTNDRIIGEKRQFAARWPIRRYSVLSESVSCGQDGAAGECSVSGVVDWMCQSQDREKKVSGVANFDLKIHIEGGRGTIVSENGSTHRP